MSKLKPKRRSRKVSAFGNTERHSRREKSLDRLSYMYRSTSNLRGAVVIESANAEPGDSQYETDHSNTSPERECQLRKIGQSYPEIRFLGLEKVDHVDLDRLTTETDGKLVTKTQNPTTASSTVDMRSRSSAFRSVLFI